MFLTTGQQLSQFLRIEIGSGGLDIALLMVQNMFEFEVVFLAIFLSGINSLTNIHSIIPLTSELLPL